jgi:hypothetical protein
VWLDLLSSCRSTKKRASRVRGMTRREDGHKCRDSNNESVGQLRGGGGGESVVTVLKQLCLF